MNNRTQPRRSQRGLLIGGFIALMIGLVAVNMSLNRGSGGQRIDPNDSSQVASGQQLYMANCASCHGARLEGQANWQLELPGGGRLAPPHDQTGHTWHHPDQYLFEMTKYGGQPYSPEGYKNNMPGFGNQLSDTQIWAVLSYIKSAWPQEVREAQERAK